MTNEVLQKTASDEQNISSSNGLEPSLRFKNFTKKWNSISLKEIGTFQKGAPLSKADISQEGNPFILYGELYTTYSEVTYNVFRKTNKKVDKIYFSNVGDVILPTSGETPEEIATATCIMIPDVILAGDLYIFRQNKIDGRILSYIINHTVNGKISRIAQGKSVVHVLSEELGKIIINYPTNDEQQKIADFLSLIDQRIKKQRQLVESLKKYKRGLLSCIFDNKLIGENWKKYKLSSILKERSTYSEKDGSYEHVTLSRDGIIPKTERYDRDFLVSSENKKYKITKMGDICYNPANMKFGVICLNTYGNAIFSPIYITFEIKSDFDKPFVGLYMTRNDFINRSLKFQQGTVYERMAVSPEDLLSMDIELPNLEAQKRISNIFTILDKKIVRENNIFNELQKMKRALLQQMFI